MALDRPDNRVSQAPHNKTNPEQALNMVKVVQGNSVVDLAMKDHGKCKEEKKCIGTESY